MMSIDVRFGWMTDCVYCRKRKGKRVCPALDGLLCPQCCGIHRLREIACPSGCAYLPASGRRRTMPSRAWPSGSAGSARRSLAGPSRSGARCSEWTCPSRPGKRGSSAGGSWSDIPIRTASTSSIASFASFLGRPLRTRRAHCAACETSPGTRCSRSRRCGCTRACCSSTWFSTTDRSSCANGWGRCRWKPGTPSSAGS